MDTQPSFEKPEGVGISRRTVTKAMAWAIPVAVVASAAPAYAASGTAPALEQGAACKEPGNSCSNWAKGYIFPFKITNTESTKTIYITAVTITSSGTALSFAQASPTLPIAIAPGATETVFFNASSSNSANQVFTATVTVTWGHAADGSDHDHSPIATNVSVGSTPPSCGCPPVFAAPPTPAA